MNELRQVIEHAFDNRNQYTMDTASSEIKQAVETVMAKLDSGEVRVAEKISGEWVVHQWLKKAVLLFFKLHDNIIIDGQETKYYDKVPLKFTDYTSEMFAEQGMRVVPPATVRKGCYIGKNVILMPSYTNIGAYVDEGTMVDTWATVGSCAQIGRHVHLS